MKNKRIKRIHVAVTPIEQELLKESADSMECTVSEYVRGKLFKRNQKFLSKIRQKSV